MEQIKSKFSFLTAIFLLPILVFTIEAKEANTTLNQFSDIDKSITFTFPKGWFKNSKENPFDLQTFSKDQTINTGIFATKYADLASTTKLHDLFLRQIDDIRGKRKNFAVIEKETTYQLAEKTITTATFSGEKGVSKFYYTMSLIEFSQSKKLFAIVIQVSFPSKWDKDKAKLKAIIDSAIVHKQ